MPSPNRLSDDAGLPPPRQFDRHVGPRAFAGALDAPRNTDDQGPARQPTPDRVESDARFAPRLTDGTACCGDAYPAQAP